MGGRVVPPTGLSPCRSDWHRPPLLVYGHHVAVAGWDVAGASAHGEEKPRAGRAVHTSVPNARELVQLEVCPFLLFLNFFSKLV